MADPETVEEPARRRFTVFGLELTGCGCLLLTSPVWIVLLIWLLALWLADAPGPER